MYGAAASRGVPRVRFTRASPGPRGLVYGDNRPAPSRPSSLLCQRRTATGNRTDRKMRDRFRENRPDIRGRPSQPSTDRRLSRARIVRLRRTAARPHCFVRNRRARALREHVNYLTTGHFGRVNTPR